MVYSQAKVIAGGLAHITIVIWVFYFIMISFNKRALEFFEANKSIKLKSKVVESKTEAKPLMAVKAETEEVKEEKAQAINEISNKLEEIEKKAEDVKEKVKKKQKDKKKKKKKKDMKRD